MEAFPAKGVILNARKRNGFGFHSHSQLHGWARTTSRHSIFTIRDAVAGAAILLKRLCTRRPSLSLSLSRSRSRSRASHRMSMSSSSSANAETLVQYIVMRRDLASSWPLGSIITQACHASVAAVTLFSNDPHTLAYCSPSNLDSMRKVTLELEGEAELLKLSEKLKASDISHKVWIEQPENIPTCLATKPYPKSLLAPFFRRLKLCK